MLRSGFGGARRVVLVVVVLSVFACVVLVGMAGSALAVGTLPFLASFGSQGEAAGQFQLPRGVAVDESSDASKGDVYVADQNNDRVEKFDAVGDFVLMFGREVNETKVNEFNEAGNPHNVEEWEENVCAAASGNTCKTGVSGEGGEELKGLSTGVAVDPSSGSVYVADRANHRVDKFSPTGRFELMFGGKVNKNGTNVCRAGEECQKGETASSGEEGDGTFHVWGIDSSDRGGPDRHRVCRG